MSGIIEGYNYDIFISYRQKDNKHDGWVTEFVENLKGELESTFKEEISVYFDINLHDGLLETHDVDESLKEKLKCLIFIPIISRTYCDPKSFAWEHEFKAFVDFASNDKIGLKVKLPNGNVASRVLPVRIHDLDTEDIKQCESVLGGVLRGIEFIYKEPGVNRSLSPKDHEEKNLNNTNYRNQINKVALAIREIIMSIGQLRPHQEKESKEVFNPVSFPQKNRKTRIIEGSVIALVLVLLGFLFIPKLLKSEEQLEKSIAVLPFINDSPDEENAYFINGIMDEILNNLQKIKEFRVLSRTSTTQFNGPDRPTIPEIAKRLNVNYLVEGSGQKYGNTFVLRVQLIAANQEKHLWGKSYEQEINEVRDYIRIPIEIAQAITDEVKVTMTPEEKELIEKIPTSNMPAYNLYLKANEYNKEFSKTRDLSSYQTAVNLYRASLEIDSSFAKAYTGLAWAYYDRYYWSEFFKENFLDSCLVLVNKALTIDDKLDAAYYLRGLYFRQNGNIEEALNNYNKTLNLNPNFYSAYTEKGYLYSIVLSDNVKGLENYHKALTLVSGEERPNLLRGLGNRYADLGFAEKAIYYFKEAFSLDGNQTQYLQRLAWLEFNLENYEESLKLLEQVVEIDTTIIFNVHFYLYPPGHENEALAHAKKTIERNRKTGVPIYFQSHRIGYIFYKTGRFKEADDFFKQQINYSEESIKLNRFYAQQKHAHYDLAATYAFLGEKEKAYKNLDETNTMNFFGLMLYSFVKNDPLFASIRHEERFQKILRNMETKNQAEHDRVQKWLEEQGML